jgi:Tol biopolymer transport system component
LILPLVLAIITVRQLAALLPTDGQIAYQSSRGRGENIFLVDVRTLHSVNLTRGRALYNAAPAWSPDGEYIAFERYNRGVLGLDNTSIYIMRFDGSGVRRLSHLRHFMPAWSPDGTQIAFVSTGETIWQIAAEGGEAVRLTTGLMPDWAPMSGRLALLGRERPNDELHPGFALQLFEFAALPAQRHTLLPDEITVSAPDWSPDEAQLAMSITSGSTTRLALLAADCRVDCPAELALLALPYNGYAPDWSPDGRRLAFECQMAQRVEICAVDSDGGNLRRLTYSPPGINNRAPAWRP